MNKAVKDLNDASADENVANNEFDKEKVKYNSKLEVEKVKASSDIDRENKVVKEASTKLPIHTDAEIWTANMPKHHLESLTQKTAVAEESEDEDSSDDDSSDDE